MNISLKSSMPIFATGLLTLAACSFDTPTNKVSNYVGRNSKEYSSIVEGKNSPYVQSKLDSLAYGDVFELTNKSDDSLAVIEFRNVASQVRNGYPAETNNHRNIINNIKDYLMDSDISYKEYKQVIDISKDELGKKPFLNKLDSYIATEIQYRADKWAYKKFFKKIGVFDGIADKFQKASENIKP